MENLAKNLLEELNCDTVFTIPIFGGIPIMESMVVTWGIMLFLILISIILVRDLRTQNISKRQMILETVIGGVYNFFDDLLGKGGRRYIPYLTTVALYLALSNLMGLFGIKPPTKDLNITIALAVMSIVLIEYSGIQAKGTKKWLKSFAEPVAVVAPINVLEIFIKPLSLCMRLFGNILGGFVVMELIKQIVPVILPIPFSFYFDIFDGLIQAYVFVFLTSLFIKEAIE